MNADEMTGLGSYSSADFLDSNEPSPFNISLLNDISYSSAINNAMNKQLSEIRDKNTLNTQWNKKFREMLALKNTKLVEFLSCKLKKHPVLSSVEHFFQYFGAPLHFHKTIKEVTLDISNNILDSLNDQMTEKGFESIENFITQSTYILDEYKLIIDKILDKEKLLKMKLDNLDSINSRLKSLSFISENVHYDELMKVTEKYMATIFDENMIESEYNDIIKLYKSYMQLREVLRVIRRLDTIEKEPLCSICFENSVTHAFVPCGHTFCGGCIKRQSLSCSVCRTGVRDMVKIYFS